MSWWRSGVIYQVYPRSYADSDGDGTGDLAGITGRLDHLAALGVDAVWLSPFYPSPMDDFGYDVTDHTGVDPLFGDLADFEALVAAAHARRIRVLVDFIPAHTSYLHPWFRDARSARDSARRDWYVWADPAPGGGPPNNWVAVFGGSAWTLDEATGQYYYHAHLPEQPSLNWRNPAVRAAHHEVLRAWLDRGVDGFRIDALRHLVQDAARRDNPPDPQWRPGRPPFARLLPVHTTDQPEVLDHVRELRAVLDAYPVPPLGERILVGELYLPIDRLGAYADAGVHVPSNMHLISTPWRARAVADLVEAYEAALPAGAWPNWVLGNHDRSRVATRVGPAQARVAAVLLLTLRGTPTVYYGDEIGMTDVPIGPADVRDPAELRVPGIGAGRDPERTPMPWTPGPGAGFCPPGVRPWLPIGSTVDVASQEGDPGSMLGLYRRLLALRRAEPALGLGDYRTLAVDDELYAYERAYEGRRVVVRLNFGDRPRPVEPGAVLLSTAAHPDPAVLAPAEARIERPGPG